LYNYITKRGANNMKFIISLLLQLLAKERQKKPSFVPDCISINKCGKSQRYTRARNCGVRDFNTELHKD